MPQLLLELFSEEIPARMQGNAARDLERMARDGLSKAGLISEGLKAFAGPRRLTLVVEGLPVAQPDVSEEVKGPRVGAPDQAMDGFLRKTGLAREALVERDGVWFGHIHKTGRPTAEIIAELVEQIVRGFAWPKSMTWGRGKLRWVRPLQRILCVFNREIVPLEIDGLVAGDLSEGHRFMAETRVFRARDFDEYHEALAGHFVVLDVEERKARILEGARTLCFARGLELVEDEGLLDEVAGLAEWPTPILGDMDVAFLDLPPEVIRTSMRTHQKYFAVRKPGEAGLAPHFLVVANIEAPDGGKAIAAGNAKVLSARLSDARFFWDEDRLGEAFDRWLDKLNGVTFHAKLGTMAERVERIAALAREIAPLVGADPDKAALAARLCKADLASEMVGEFPELQGIMGGYYARAEGASFETRSASAPQDDEQGAGGLTKGRHAEEPASAGVSKHAQEIADAIRDHYRPQGPGDAVPTAPLSVAVALADKLDTLVGFFAIDEKPTGSKDPYALRRAALGIIRTVLSSSLRLPLRRYAELATAAHITLGPLSNRYARTAERYDPFEGSAPVPSWSELPIPTYLNYDGLLSANGDVIADNQMGSPGWDEDDDQAPYELGRKSFAELVRRLEYLDHLHIHFVFDNLDDTTERPLDRVYRELQSNLPGVFAYLDEFVAFLADRLKVLLRDQGKRHDLVDAVFALGDDDLVRIVARVEALSEFLATDNGANLLAAYKRAVSLLKAEEKKDGRPTEGAPVEPHHSAIEEAMLFAQVSWVTPRLQQALDDEDYVMAMGELASLRGTVYAFLDKVFVNDPDPSIRENRLKLLGEVRHLMDSVADFSLVTG